MNKYLCRVQLTSLVFYLEAENITEAKLKVQKELNKMGHQLLINLPLNCINVIKIYDLDIELNASENKIISILN